MKRLAAALAAVTLVGLATPASASGQLTLRVPVANFGPDSNNVAFDGALRLGQGADRAASARIPVRIGSAIYLPTSLPSAVNTVSAKVNATIPAGTEVAVDVRGLLPDGNWSEWTETLPAVLEKTATVQVRITLSAPDGAPSPSVSGVDITVQTSPTAKVRTAGLASRVFATREGLVGGTTANGHVITSRDHFVALPSRRGLSAKGGGSYSVQVCAANGRCAWAPVWDVGPWNTRDDYWNPTETRQEWKDLPQGKPQAQAAYQDNYNTGRDQFGRDVANPAGIDLGDGTFWDGLKLNGNAWVTVTYLWTGTGPSGFVRTAPGDPLNVRNSTNTAAAIVGMAANQAQVRVECQAVGESIDGSQGTSEVWLRIAPGKYVAKAFVTGVGNAPTC